MLRTQRSSTQFSRMNLHINTKWSFINYNVLFNSAPIMLREWKTDSTEACLSNCWTCIIFHAEDSKNVTNTLILWPACHLTPSNQSLPSHHFCKQDAQGSCCCCAAVHAPQLENHWEVDQRGDGRPCGVESQTVLDLKIRTFRSIKMTSLKGDRV